MPAAKRSSKKAATTTTIENQPTCDSGESAGGVFISQRSLLSCLSSRDRDYSSSSSLTSFFSSSEDNDDDNDDDDMSSSELTPTPAHWISSGIRDFLKGCPLVVSDPEKAENENSLDEEDQAVVLHRILVRSRRLPGTWYFSSNHVMVNQERTSRMAAPLTRLRELDEIAREQAGRLAFQGGPLVHTDPAELHRKFNRPCRRLGENVARGKTIRDIHALMMCNPADKNNIMDRRYTHMGMGTAQSKDGTLYLCQIFRG